MVNSANTSTPAPSLVQNLGPYIGSSQLLKDFFASNIDPLFTANTSTPFNFYIGGVPTYNNPTIDFYKPEPDLERTVNQLTPATVTVDPITNDITNAIFHNDYVNALRADDGPIHTQNRLFEQQYYCWCPPIDLDKYLNFDQYIWLENGPTPVEITDPTNAGLQIVGALNYTTPSGVVFTSGMEVIFRNDINPNYNDINFIVEGVGRGIRLIADGTGWDEAPWDGIQGDVVSISRSSTAAIIGGNIQAEFTLSINNQTYPVPLIDKDMDGVITNSELFYSLQQAGLPPELNFYYDTPTDRTIIVSTVSTLPFTLQDLIGNGTAVVDFFGKSPITSVHQVVPWDNNFSTVQSNFEDYITIERGSLDNNPWSQTNRWFPLALATAEQIAAAPHSHAVRPIIEFRRDTELFNYGNFRREAVDVVYTYSLLTIQMGNTNFPTPPDAGFLNNFSFNTNQYTMFIDGEPIFNGMRILVLVDLNPNAQGYVFVLNIDPTGIIYFTLATDGMNSNGSPANGEIVSVNFGANGEAANEFYFNGAIWAGPAQHRTAPNTPPLFNLYDSESNALNDPGVYPNSTFAGCKLFGYELGTGTADAVLGFPVIYNSAGDLVFQNFQVTDFTAPAYTWYKEVESETSYFFSNSWHTVPSLSNQALIDLLPYSSTTRYKVPTPVVPDEYYLNFLEGQVNYVVPLQFVQAPSYSVTVNGIVLEEGVDYTIDVINPTSQNIVFTLAYVTEQLASNAAAYFGIILPVIGKRSIVVTSDSTTLLPGIDYDVIGLTNQDLYVTDSGNAKIDQTTGIRVAICTLTASDEEGGAWAVPDNIAANSNNDVVTTIGINEVFQHFVTIIENQVGFSGSPYSANNYGDTAKAQNIGSVILQHSGPLLIPSIVSGISALDPLEGVAYAEREYVKVRNKILQLFNTLVNNGTMTTTDSVQSWLTAIFNQLVLGKTNDFPFAWSNMAGGKYWIPPTPAYLGIMPNYVPGFIVKNGFTYLLGHDGSLLANAGDFRDAVMLALEQLIYQSIPSYFTGMERPLFDLEVLVSGKFRTGVYTPQEIAAIQQQWFLRWTVKNKITDYRLHNNYDPSQPFTWNFSTCVDKDGVALPGNWTAIYRFYYDTERPDQAPWEMLGFTSEPSWWVAEYGVAPYGRNHAIIWGDLELGLIRQGPRAGINPVWARPGLSQYIPVDDFGNLLNPIAAGIVQSPPLYTAGNAPWAFGDGGPVEQLWRDSESYPFAETATGWLAKAGEFQALAWDPLHTVIDTRPLISGSQIYNSQLNCRPPCYDLQVDSEVPTGTSAGVMNSGYQSYISNYVMQTGASVGTTFGNVVRGLQPMLANRVAGFIDGSNLEVQADNFGALPSDNTQLFLYKGTSFEEPFYSGVIIQWTGSTWQVTGYDINNPVFGTIPGDINGPKLNITVEPNDTIVPAPFAPNTFYQTGQLVTYQDGTYRALRPFTSSTTFEISFWAPQIPVVQADGRIIQEYLNPQQPITVQYVPYYTEFATQQDVYNFLIAYQRYLEQQGWVFDQFNDVAQATDDWALAGKRFLMWSRPALGPGFLIALSPAARYLEFSTNQGTVLPVEDTQFGIYSLLNRDGVAIPRKETQVSRLGGDLQITIPNYQTTGGLYGASISIANIEHIMIFSNVTDFGNLVYSPLLNIQQGRLRISSIGEFNWDGRLEIPGFILTGNSLTIDYGNLIIANGDTLTSNFEKSANDFRLYFGIEDVVSDPTLRGEARANIGYTPRDYLENIFDNDTSEFEFYIGMLRAKGSPGVFTALLRSILLNQNIDLSFFEEWAILEQPYGADHLDLTIEHQLFNTDIKTNPQIIFYSNLPYDPPTNEYNPYSTVDTIYVDDPRWIVQPQNPNDIWPYRPIPQPGQTFPGDYPTAGYVKLTEYDYQAFNIAGLQTLWTNLNTAGTLLSLTGDINLPSSTNTEGARLWIYNWPQMYGIRNTLDWNMLKPVGSPVPIAFSAPTSNFASAIFVLESAPVVSGAPGYVPFLTDEMIIGVTQLGATPAVNQVYQTIMHEARVQMNAATGTTATIFTATQPVQIVELLATVLETLVTNPTIGLLFTLYVNNTPVITGIDLTSGTAALTDISIPMNTGDVLSIRTSFSTTITDGQISFKARWATIRTVEQDINLGTLQVDLVQGQAQGQLLSLSANLEALIATNNVLGVNDHINLVFTSVSPTNVVTTLAYVNDVQNITQTGPLTLVTSTALPIDIIPGQTIKATLVFDITTIFPTPTTLTDGLIANDANWCYNFEFELQDPVAGTNVIVNSGNSPGQFWLLQPQRFLDNGTEAGGLYFTGNSVWPASQPVYSPPATEGWLNGDIVYLDNWINYGTVPPTNTGNRVLQYESGNWNIVRVEFPKVNSALFRQNTILNPTNNTDAAAVDIFDPAKGFGPGIALSVINYIEEYDPAVYTNVTDDTQSTLNLLEPWGPAQQGFIWWDLTVARYLDYEIDDPSVPANLSYRATNWGQLAPGSVINIYEWTRSTTLPTAQTTGIRLPLAFVTNTEVDPATNTTIQAYYYWNLNPSAPSPYVPRTLSALEISILLTTPQANLSIPADGSLGNSGISWLAPIAPNALVVSNVQDALNSNSTRLRVRWRDTDSTVPPHTQWIFMNPGDENSVPADYQWNKFMDCLVGENALGLPVPDPNLTTEESFGIAIRPSQSWFSIESGLSFPQQARFEFVTTVNRILSTVNIRRDRVLAEAAITLSDPYPIQNPNFVLAPDLTGEYRLPAEFDENQTIIYLIPAGGGLARILRNGIDYVMVYDPILNYLKNGIQSRIRIDFIPSAPMGILLANEPTWCQYIVPDLYTRDHTSGITPGYQVLVQQDSTVNNYWVNYAYLGTSGGSPVWCPVDWQHYRTADYWTPADWYGEDLSGNTYNSLDTPRFTFNTIAEMGQTQPYRPGDLIMVLNTNVPVSTRYWQWFVYTLDTNGNAVFTEVAEQNATLILLPTLYAPEQTPEITPDANLFLELNDPQSGSLTLDQSFDFVNWTPFDYGLPGFHPRFGWSNGPYDQQIQESILQRLYESFLGNFGLFTANDDLRELANGLRSGVLEGIEINELWFEMIKVAHVQCPEVTWAFKTSYMTINNYQTQLYQPAIQTPDLLQNVIDFVNEVKPYHVQIRNLVTQVALMDTGTFDVTDFDDPPWYDSNLMMFRPLNPSNATDQQVFTAPGSLWNPWWIEYQKVLGGSPVANANFRKMQITLTFDRVSCQPDQGWDDTGFDVYGWDTGPYHAAERVIEYYMPVGGQLALKPLGNVIGCDYKGTVMTPVTPNFNVMYAGWDPSYGWDGIPWDSGYPVADLYNAANDDVEVQGGTGYPFSSFLLNLSRVIAFALDDQREEFGYDQNFQTFVLPTDDPTLYPFIKVTVNGTVVTNYMILPNSNLLQFTAPLNDGDLLEISFGQTFLPPPNRDEDILIEGGRFVQPDLDGGHPQELIALIPPDDLSIDVYVREYAGPPRIVNNRFMGSGITGPYAIGQKPQNEQALLIWKNGVLLKNGPDYHVDWFSLQVTFAEVVAPFDIVVIFSYSHSACPQSVTTHSWQGVGSMGVDWDLPPQAVDVIRNGEPVPATFEIIGTRVHITVDPGPTPITPHDYFTAVLYDRACKAVVRTDELNLQDANLYIPLTFTLSQPVASDFPPWGTVLVHLNGLQLNGPWTEFHIGRRPIDPPAPGLNQNFLINFPYNQVDNITAYLDGKKLKIAVMNVIAWTVTEWENPSAQCPIGYDGFVYQLPTPPNISTSLWLNNPLPEGALLVIARMEEFDYMVNGDQLQVFHPVMPTDRLTVTTVNNDEAYAIRTQTFLGTADAVYITGFDTEEFDTSPFDDEFDPDNELDGRDTYPLAFIPETPDGVFAYVNGQLKIYGLDWHYVGEVPVGWDKNIWGVVWDGTQSPLSIKFHQMHQPTDVTSIVYLTSPALESAPPVAMRMHIDRFQNREDIRISDRFRFRLRDSIGPSDEVINLNINMGLSPDMRENLFPKPNYTGQVPGVIWIGGERIEYYEVNGPFTETDSTDGQIWYTLKKVRRATKGTTDGLTRKVDTVRYAVDGVQTSFKLPDPNATYTQVVVLLANYVPVNDGGFDDPSWDTVPFDKADNTVVWDGDFPLTMGQDWYFGTDGDVILTTAPAVPNPTPDNPFYIQQPLPLLIRAIRAQSPYVHFSGDDVIDGGPLNRIPGGYEFPVTRYPGWSGTAWDTTAWSEPGWGYKEYRGRPFDANFGLQFNRNRVTKFLRESPGTRIVSQYIDDISLHE